MQVLGAAVVAGAEWAEDDLDEGELAEHELELLDQEAVGRRGKGGRWRLKRVRNVTFDLPEGGGGEERWWS